MKQGAKPLHVTFAVSAQCVVYALQHGGNSPTLSELADHFGVTRHAVDVVLNRMMRYGIARRDDGKLFMVGGQYVPPQWYIDNVMPPLSAEDLSETARYNRIIQSVAGR